MNNLQIREFNGRTIRIRQSDRYVCLTDMAKASGKLFADWKRLKTTESYLATFSESMGIPIDRLIEVNESQGSNEDRGTWGHPKVALRFAQWCSDEFAVQVDCWIDELLTTGKVELQPTQTSQPIDPQDLSMLRVGLTSINPALVDGFILNELGKLKPALLPQIMEAHKLLASVTEIPEVLMTPTIIGKELGISAIKVNKLLTGLGYQIKNENKSKGSPDYVPTETGKNYAELTMSTGHSGDNTTYQHLKWKRSIIDILSELI